MSGRCCRHARTLATSCSNLHPAGSDLFLAWAAWVCVWAAAMILALTALGACRYIYLFTRFSGELFGALIAVSPLRRGIFRMQVADCGMQELCQELFQEASLRLPQSLPPRTATDLSAVIFTFHDLDIVVCRCCCCKRRSAKQPRSSGGPRGRALL